MTGHKTFILEKSSDASQVMGEVRSQVRVAMKDLPGSNKSFNEDCKRRLRGALLLLASHAHYAVAASLTQNLSLYWKKAMLQFFITIKQFLAQYNVCLHLMFNVSIKTIGK